MIIDSHAHYSHFWFENVYKYIQYEDGKYSLMQSNRTDMLQNFREFGIQLCIEPTARYSQIEHQLQVVGGNVALAILVVRAILYGVLLDVRNILLGVVAEQNMNIVNHRLQVFKVSTLLLNQSCNSLISV